MGIIDAIILGIVEGLTEFLPISSTGHMILASRLLNLPTTEFLKTFEIVIQLGAIAAIVIIYWRSLTRDWAVMKRVAAAFIPTAIVGLIVYKGVKAMLGNADIVAWSLLIGGLIIIVFEAAYSADCPLGRCGLTRAWAARLGRWGRRLFPAKPLTEVRGMTYRQAVGIGLCQTLAMIPGVSRSAATVIGGLSLGLDRRAIVEFSFLLAVPTMLAASALDLLKSAPSFTAVEIDLLVIGFLTAFVTAWLVVKWFLNYVKRHDFTIFGFYRILAALAYWFLIR